MKNDRKTKEHLTNELVEARRRIAELEASEARSEKARQKLQRRMAELESVFTALSAPVIVFGANGILVQANPAAVSACGFDPVGMDLETLIQKLSFRHTDGRPIALEELPWYRALKGEVVIDKPIVFAHCETGDVIALASASPLEKHDEVAGAVTTWRDVAEHQRLQEELRRSKEELITTRLQAKKDAEEARRRATERETIIQSIADGVFVCNKEGRVIEVNEAGLKLIGLTRREEALVPFADYLSMLDLRHPDERPMLPHEMPLSRALLGEAVRNSQVLARSLRTKQDMYLLVSAAPVHDLEGNVVGAVAVINDITSLREIDKLKDEFISVAAHELKTPVTIMKGYSELLLRTAVGILPPHRKMLEAIDRGADRIDQIVKDLLNISRLRLGFLELTMERIDLPELVEQVVQQIAPTTTKHVLRLVRMEPAVIQGDRIRLEEVLDNLLDNAIKYSPEGGDIEIAVTIENREAVVSVRDHGVGIPIDKQAHIFERFYRAHTGTPYDYGGMGVGLYISREIISRHGGEMWFESEEGKGSIFYFSLPLA